MRIAVTFYLSAAAFLTNLHNLPRYDRVRTQSVSLLIDTPLTRLFDRPRYYICPQLIVTMYTFAVHTFINCSKFREIYEENFFYRSNKTVLLLYIFYAKENLSLRICMDTLY